MVKGRIRSNWISSEKDIDSWN